MKKTISFLLMFWGILCFAQEDYSEINTDFADQINHVFEYVEKERVPHGLLQDYAFEFTELSAYNGTITDTNAVHVGSYQAIYSTLFMAQVREGVPGMYPPQEFRDRWNTERKLRNEDNGGIPHLVLSGLHFQYSLIDEGALPE